MKGIVFTEFLKMVEQNYGYEVVDELIENNDLASKGAYTTIGTYSHSEIVQLITSLSSHTKESIPSLLKIFGLYFFDTLKNGYPHFLEARSNAFEFLESIETYIHVEVQKLYPEAELPSFDTQVNADNQLEMIYRSDRKMADFAEGLIERSLEYYGEQGKIDRESIKADGSIVKFVITQP